MHGHRWAPWSSSLLLLLLACGAGHATRTSDGAATGSDADQQLARSAALDYKAPPSRDRATLRESAFGLYAKACAGGNASACWHALEVPPARDRALLRDVIVGTGRSCAAGDATSCQALASAEVQLKGLAAHDDADFTALCERGVGAACELTPREACRRGETASCEPSRACLAGDTFACDEALQAAMHGGAAAAAKALSARTLEAATQECDRGVTYACWWLVARAGGDAEKLRTTVVESCAHGIVDDCATVGAEVTQADPRAQAEAYAVPCRRWGRHCDHVAQLHAPDGPIPDPAALRDAHEHACQLGANDDCLGLAKAYLAHQLPEPVPGRGKDLATFLCSAGESGAHDAGCAALHAADGSK